jgi:hypothetical protein
MSTATIHTLRAAPTDDEYPPIAKNFMLFVVMMRRGIRRTVAALDQQRDQARQYRRQAQKLLARENPFDGARIAALDALADVAAAACEPLRETMKQSGEFLAEAARMIDAGLTLSQRCEILNVNAADRGDLTDADGLHSIVFAHGLEDSAARRKGDGKNGPLLQSLREVFIDFMLNHAEGRKLRDNLFEPGGMFERVPMYQQAPDGTMKRQPPRLRVVPGARTEAAGNAGL